MAVVINEQVDLLNQIKTQLTPYCKGVTIEIEEDPFKLVEDNILPFIVIHLTNFNIGIADNLPMQHMQRHNYAISLYFATVGNSRKDAMISNTGIWSLYYNIKQGIDSDLSFNRLCSTAPIIPETAVNCVPQKNGLKWTGRGDIKFTLYKDYKMF